MDNAEKVKKFLMEHPGTFFCNGCLSAATGVSPENQVNQITRPLRDVKPYRGGKVVCSVCGKEKECIACG